MTATATQPTHETPPPTAPRRQRRGASWGPALRMARREIRRSRARSALVVALVMLPVLVVTFLSVMLRSTDVSAVERLPWDLGSSDASVTVATREPEQMPVAQCPDLSCWASGYESGGTPAEQVLPPTDAIHHVVGAQARLVPVAAAPGTAIVGDQQVGLQVSELDIADPLVTGMVQLRSGRPATGPDEVTVTEPLAERGATTGSTVRVSVEGQPDRLATVVGVVRSWRADLEVIGAPGGLGLPFDTADAPDGQTTSWLVDAPAPVSWEQVLELNAHGLTVLSRAVVEDPPSSGELSDGPPTTGTAGMTTVDGSADATVIVALIAAMVLLEVVLLAGPAFAVSASTQTRAMGQVAAQGGTRRDLRRICLALALVLGGLATVAGATLGLLGARLAYPLTARTAPTSFGPFQVGWPDILVVGAFGLGAAMLAALLPAWSAARLDPVAAIAGGRRAGAGGRHVAATAAFVPGLLLIVTGIVLAVFVAFGPHGATVDGLALVGAGVAPILGAVLVAPMAILLAGRVAQRAAFPVRYALRDMARNLMRTAPAVAAITAVVAGAVALSISGTSDTAQEKAMHTPQGPQGDMVVTLSGDDGAGVSQAVGDQVVDLLTPTLPGARISQISGLPDAFYGPGWTRDTLVLSQATVVADGMPSAFDPQSIGFVQQSLSTGSRWYGTALLIGPDGLAAIRSTLTDEQAADAQRALDSGAAVVLRNFDGPATGTATFDVLHGKPGAEDFEGMTPGARLTVPAIGLQIRGVSVPAVAVVPDSLVADSGLVPHVAAIWADADHDLTQVDVDRASKVLGELSQDTPRTWARSYVETGWHNDLLLPLLILAAGAAVLVLAGALTASLLALSDARPDFATLGAVGAAPRTRRLVAGWYGWAIASLGALLGAAVGFIPGIALTYPLTRTSPGSTPDHTGMVDLWGNPLTDHFLRIPWPLIGALVIGLPILIGLLTALCTRSRLPMVARMS